MSVKILDDDCVNKCIKKTRDSSCGLLKVSFHIKDILTNEFNSNAYKAQDGKDWLSIFYALHYINVRQVPESEIREMFEIKDAYMINPNASGTCHCLNIQTDLKSKPFC